VVGVEEFGQTECVGGAIEVVAARADEPEVRPEGPRWLARDREAGEMRIDLRGEVGKAPVARATVEEVADRGRG
jgi:hypothetical protein